MHLWSKYYFNICTNKLPRPWPNTKIGLSVKQYTFKTKSYPELSYLHKLWYRWSDELEKYIKIVPNNIGDLLTPIGLAYYPKPLFFYKGTPFFFLPRPSPTPPLFFFKGVGVGEGRIMDDGYKSGNAVVLCTDSFTLDEVHLLVSVLKDNFDLIATINRRAQEGKLIGWRIRISG